MKRKSKILALDLMIKHLNHAIGSGQYLNWSEDIEVCKDIEKYVEQHSEMLRRRLVRMTDEETARYLATGSSHSDRLKYEETE